MKAAKTPKKFLKMPHPPKKKLLKRKWNSITPAKTNSSISQTSSKRLKLIIETDQMRNKEIKMKLGQLQEKISKASLPVSADLCNNFKSNQLFCKLTKEKINLHKVDFGRAAKIPTIFYQ